MTLYRQNGFSLLEVLVAFSILAISLGILYQAFGGSLRNLGIAGNYGRAMVIAESALARVTADLPLQVGVVAGKEERFRWRVEITPYDDIEVPHPIFDPYRVEVEVSWEEGWKERRYRLQTLRLSRR